MKLLLLAAACCCCYGGESALPTNIQTSNAKQTRYGAKIYSQLCVVQSRMDTELLCPWCFQHFFNLMPSALGLVVQGCRVLVVRSLFRSFSAQIDSAVINFECTPWQHCRTYGLDLRTCILYHYGRASSRRRALARRGKSTLHFVSF